ncbi:MAG: hypothetical protein MN733_20595 [Nitrososphaera sp.]|nr:hypothetical protein [Nitrososphaera sp.]
MKIGARVKLIGPNTPKKWIHSSGTVVQPPTERLARTLPQAIWVDVDGHRDNPTYFWPEEIEQLTPLQVFV